MTIFENLVFSLLDIIEVMIVSLRLFGLKKEVLFKKRNIIYIMVVVLLAAGLSNIFEDGYVFVVNMLMLVMVIKQIYKISIYKGVYGYAISAIIIVGVQLLVFSGMGLFMDMSYSLYSALLVHLITIGILLIIYKCIPLEIMMNDRIMKSNLYRIIILNIFLLLIGCLVFLVLQSEVYLVNLLSFFSIILLIVVVNIVLFVINSKRETELKQLSVYERYLPIIEELMVEIRRKQHDYDNHVESVYMQLQFLDKTNPDVMAVEQYIKEIKEDKRVADLSKIKHKILAGLIYSKQLYFKDVGIIFCVNIQEYLLDTKLKNYELIEVVSILLDNAGEAIDKGQHIVLNISKENNYNVIEVQNEHEFITADIVSKMFEPGYSYSESCSRGYGLYNLTQIIKKYKGKYVAKNVTINGSNYFSVQVEFE